MKAQPSVTPIHPQQSSNPAFGRVEALQYDNDRSDTLSPILEASLETSSSSTSSNNLSALQQNQILPILRTRLPGSTNYHASDETMPALAAGTMLSTPAGDYEITQEVGEAFNNLQLFAAVHDGAMYEVSAAQPANESEFYTLHELSERLVNGPCPRALASIPALPHCFVYANGSIIATEVLDDFNLDDLISAFGNVSQSVVG